jgi:hypothetical protein
MKKSTFTSDFSKSTLTGLFTGIIATVLCLFFNAEYRNLTYFNPADFINVSSLIFVVNLLFLCFGLLHFLFTRLFKAGERIYMVFSLVLTLGCIWIAKDVHRAADPIVNRGFKGLLDGVILINGLCSAGVVPLLFHSKKFEEEVLGKPEI